MTAPLSAARVLVRYPRAALSHVTAATLLGIEVPLQPEEALPSVSVPRSHGHVRLSGWDVHRVALGGDVRQLVDGLRVTEAGRTVADLACALDVGPAVAAADSALRLALIDPAELVAALDARRGTGSRRCREVASLLDPASGSVLESLLRVVLREAGLPAPVTQYEIPGGHARVDFCWPAQRLVVEADGFAFHSDRLAYRRDRERLNRLESLGWRVLRFTWEDVVSRPAYVVALVRTCLSLAA